MHKVRVPFCLALLAIIICQPNCKANALTSGEELYKREKFSAAKPFLESAIAANPRDAVAHYLLGNVLVKLNKQSDAIKHYEVASRLKPDDEAGQFSRMALAEMRGCARQFSAASPNTGDTDERRDLKESVTKIGQATDAAKSDSDIQCAAKVKEITEQSQSRVRELENELKSYLYINRPVYRPRSGVLYTPDNEPTKADYANRIAAVQDEARRKIDQAQLYCKQKQIAMEDSAVSLDQSYAHGPNGGSVRLNPRGSSLFVRNYETESEPSGDPVAVLAQPKALTLPKTAHK